MNLLHANQITLMHGQKIVCQDFNFSLRAGEVWGVLGQNGCGKTTLLHAFAGLHPLEQGDIFLGENKLKQLTMKTIAQTLGILFQDVNTTFPQTVWDYCAAGRFPHLAYFQKESEKDEAIIQQSLNKMDLDSLNQRLITRLSGGEKRRLAIAALLAQTPQIYLLDEPTNHLDMRHQMRTLKHFRQLAKSTSVGVIMSLHDVNLAQQFCDYVLLMFADGEMVSGKTREILTSDHLTRLYQHPIVPIIHDGNTAWRAVN